jgi:hypothetical protein
VKATTHSNKHLATGDEAMMTLPPAPGLWILIRELVRTTGMIAALSTAIPKLAYRVVNLFAGGIHISIEASRIASVI